MSAPRRAGPPAPDWSALTAEAAELERQGEWQAAAAAYARLRRRAAAHRDAATAVRALRLQARQLWRLGRHPEAERIARQSWREAERHGLRAAAAAAMNVVAAIRHAQQDLGAAADLYAQARELALDEGDDELVGLAAQNLGVLASLRGDAREARILYLESIGSATRSGSRASALMTYNNLAFACADLGDWMEAEVYYGRGIEIAEQLGDTHALAGLYANHARPLIHMGELDTALASLDAAEALALRCDAGGTLADIARFRGVIARLLGDDAAAERHLAEALKLSDAGGCALEAAETLEELAHLRRQQRRPGAARATLREAVRRYREIGALRDAERLEALGAAWRPPPAAGAPATAW